PADVRASIQHLTLLRRFATIDVLELSETAGPIVRFALTPLQRIGDYRIDGEFEMASRDLERAIRDRLGAAPTAAQGADAVAAVQALLGEHGYLQPQIDVRVEPMDEQGTVRLVVSGHAGPLWRLGRITLVGAD